MAKRQKGKKKKRSSTRSQSQARSSSGRRWLDNQLDEADRLEQAGEYEKAFELLLTLEKKYPRNRDLLAMLANVTGEMKDWANIAIYNLRLYPLETGNERALALNNLIAASITLELPGLACQTASILLKDHPTYHVSNEAKTFLQRMQPQLFDNFDDIELLFKKFGGDEAKILDFIAEHDLMTLFTDIGNVKETIYYCRRLLAQWPGFTPAINNMGFAYFRGGDLAKAIETTGEVLAQEADNSHALGNLARYYFLSGETEVAWGYANQLKGIDNDSPRRWSKQIETLAYLGDDEGVRDAYLEAREHDSLNWPLFLHLAAAAHYRLGDEAKAWELWQEALRIDPSFLLAKMNLAERSKAPHERHAGWYWPLAYWFAGDIRASLLQFLPDGENKAAVKRGIKKLLKQYPQLPILTPHILQCGDPLARTTLISLIELVKRADLSRALLLFGLSPYGPDADRIKALQFLGNHHPEMLPADRKVTVWHEGEQRDILLLSFKITSLPRESGLDDETYNIFLEAHRYLNEKRDLERAEEAFMKVIDAYPDFTAAYNQLTLIYQLQGRHGEAKTLMKETHRRFPDYFFSRISLARTAIQNNRLDDAREYLNPLLKREEIHFSELRALAQAEIEYNLAIDEQEGARMWLNMWQNVEKEHPDIPAWKARIEDSDSPLQQAGISPEEARRVFKKLLDEIDL